MMIDFQLPGGFLRTNHLTNTFLRYVAVWVNLVTNTDTGSHLLMTLRNKGQSGEDSC